MRLRPYFNTTENAYYVEVTFDAPTWRTRRNLNVTEEADVPAALDKFSRHILPNLQHEHQQRARQAQDLPPANPNDPALRDLFQWYTQTHLPGHARPATTQKYTQVLHDLLLYLHQRRIGRASQVTFRILQEWQAWYEENRHGRTNGRHAPKTREDQLTIIRAWFNAAADAGELHEKPIKKWLMPPKGKRRKKALTRQELQQVLHVTDKTQAGPLCQFLAHSGWRVSDAIDLRVGEIDQHAWHVDRDTIKTEDQLCYPLFSPLREIVQTALQGRTPAYEDHLFLRPDGSPFTYDSIYNSMTRALVTAKFPRKGVSPHAFRTTFATHAAKGDKAQGIPPMPVKVLQNLLSHKNVKTTLEYYTEIELADLAEWGQRIAKGLSANP